MKQVLKNGKISVLLSDKKVAGWSKEVHLIEYKNKKYVIRRCKKLAKAKNYEKISKAFEKYGFLPKFLGRFGKEVIYEYLEGRDLTKKESPKVIKQVGEIAARVNKIKAIGAVSTMFNKQLKECVSGFFKKANKKSKPILTEQKAKDIKKLYNQLKKECKPIMALDISDMNPDNFRLRKEKVYLVDVESIKPRVKGFGIGKAFTKWFKKPKQRREFIKGYAKVSSAKFLTEKYIDFISLNFLIQELNQTCFYGKKFKPRTNIRKEELDNLLNKY